MHVLCRGARKASAACLVVAGEDHLRVRGRLETDHGVAGGVERHRLSPAPASVSWQGVGAEVALTGPANSSKGEAGSDSVQAREQATRYSGLEGK